MDERKELWPGWKTVRLIGRGSFGAVYEIERNLLGDSEKAALKLISIPQNDSDIRELRNDGYDDESLSSAFKGYLQNIVNEYSLMRKMNGFSNVVNCDDVRFEPHSDNIGWDIFIKMELLSPFAEVLPRQISEKQVINVGMDISRALVLCRKYGIVHRDIKPQNIFVSSNGDYKLGDFGIAKTMEKTSGGTKIGTYKYMAPEVFNNKPYNHSADIYSLGLVLYWMLNERRMPFVPLPPALPGPGEDEAARMRRFAGEKIPAPKNGSAELKRIVLKACEYRPELRYQSAAELLQDLEDLSGHSHTVAEPAPVKAASPVLNDDEATVSAFSGKTKTEPEDEATVSAFKPENSKASKKPKSGKTKIAAIAAAVLVLLLIAGGVLGFKLHSSNREAIENSAAIRQELLNSSSISVFGTYGADCHILAVKNDGSVVAAGDNSCSQCDVEQWSDISAVAAGAFHSLGLRTDGSVVAAGDNSCGQCDVQDWTEIVAIAAGDSFSAGLRADGTVVLAGDLSDFSGEFRSWENIISIKAGADHLTGLQADGRVVADGFNDTNLYRGRCDTAEWQDVVSLAKGDFVSLGICSDGSIVHCGPNSRSQCNIEPSEKILAVSVSDYHSAVLYYGGRVECLGNNSEGQCETQSWEDIAEIAVCEAFTVGIKSDGSIVYAGDCSGIDLSDFYDLKIN